jgi:addiction module HigA family antidote
MFMRPKPDSSGGKAKAWDGAAPRHPGDYVREEVLKPGTMTVTDAAKVIGISRPGVSNFLNGKVAASPEMASRIERAFKIPAKTLLDMQAAYDAAQAKAKGAAANTKAYVPPFLAIKANHIEEWASNNIPARIRVSVLLRTLVHSTGFGLTKVNFPGNDDAERPGWDGFVEASEGTPWIPAGTSGWEFGTNTNIKGKADKDFAKSVKALGKSERVQITFVFVTPRRWHGKESWLAEAKAKNQWKDVRAYDANDLEQWLEQSLAAQAWFANETHRPSQNVRSLDKCWSDWAEVADPPLTGALFSSAIEAAKRTMLSQLSKSPDGPTVIAADSVEEALALLSQLLGEAGGTELASYRDRVLVFEKPDVLPRLAQGAQNFIPVVFKRDVERELAPFVRSMHCIVVYPRNATNAQPHIVLEPVHHEAFRTALEGMKCDRDEISKLANASGRSLTILRRQLSIVEAVRTPEWAVDHKTAASLAPFLFVGAWNSANETDREGLSLLAGRPYEELEKECQSLARLNDAPVWSIGTVRGVISKIDLMYAIAGSITADDLKRYFSVARMVLGEDDPALDLPEEERWAASLHGKSRDFSGAFREGISETLVLLAVHGNNLFKRRLGLDVEIEVARVVQDLLPTPLIMRTLEANDRDLPTYAEAAPDAFLSIIERDLRTDQPVVLGLLRPVDAGFFGRTPSRTGLLWALEGLSWSPVTLPRAALILARLAEVEINDNWVNKPTHSLESIFRVWMPQTAASHDIRLDVMRKLAERFPQVAWRICVAQFGVHHQVGDYSHKPRWRPDGYGFGEPFRTRGPVIAFMREMVEMALSWKDYSLSMLSDLIERLHDLEDAHQAKVWDLVKSWAAERGDFDKAALREKIRVTIMSRRGRRRSKNGEAVALNVAAKAAYATLEPRDILNKHAWLFREGWVEESADEIESEEIDFRKREERITKLRTEALREIIAERGLNGIFELADRGKAAWQIGVLLVQALLPKNELPDFLCQALKRLLSANDKTEEFSKKNLLSGALRAIEDEDKRVLILTRTIEDLSKDEIVHLLLVAPFRRSTWKLVDGLNDAHQSQYWRDIGPDWIHVSESENKEAVERLLAAQRPRAAFSCIRFEAQKVDASLLFRLLSGVAKGGNDLPGHYQLEQYNIEQAFKQINDGADLTLDQKAALEFAFIDVLARPWSEREGYGIPNLERYVEDHPEMFVQAVVWAYKRNDGAKDPVEWSVAAEDTKRFAERGYKLLEGLERVPGHDDLGELQADRLAKWIRTVRAQCAKLDRAEVGDINLGKLLSSAPEGKDGVWPCEPVRQVMEDLQSERISSGAHTGLYNARGVHWRGEGGDQERELSAQYRKWAEALQYSHPFVSSNLLMGMVKTYEHEANREDTAAGIRRRMR